MERQLQASVAKNPSSVAAKGSRFSDGSATDAQGRRFEVQTVDTKADGSLTQRELDAASDIAERSGNPVVCVPRRGSVE